jgi:hypothetical protein
MSVYQTPPGEGGGAVSLYLSGTQRSVTGLDSLAKPSSKLRLVSLEAMKFKHVESKRSRKEGNE